MATACWKQVSWTAGLVRAPRGKWLTAAADPPGGGPGRLGADGAAKQQKELIKQTTFFMIRAAQTLSLVHENGLHLAHLGGGNGKHRRIAGS